MSSEAPDELPDQLPELDVPPTDVPEEAPQPEQLNEPPEEPPIEAMPFEQLESIVLPSQSQQSPPAQEPPDVIRSEDLFLPPLDENDNPSWLEAPPRLSDDLSPCEPDEKSVQEQQNPDLAVSALQNAPEPAEIPEQNGFTVDSLFNPQGFGAEPPVEDAQPANDEVFNMDDLDELPPDMDDF